MENRFWIVCYDIADGRRLRRVARVMERFGTRVQKSVFECRLTTQNRGELETALKDVLVSPPDRVRWYTACADCQRETTLQTGTEIIEDLIFYIV